MTSCIRTLSARRCFEELKPYMDDGSYMFMYGEGSGSSAVDEFVVAFNPETLEAHVFPIDPAPSGEARRWDAVWRLADYCNRRAEIEHGRRF